MDNSELHYLTYDPDEIMANMMLAYIEAGGDVLSPGDEKEILLQAVLQIMTQAFAGIDNALRMDTLRYAVRDYLDVYGEKRGCVRIEAESATAQVKITMTETGTAATIPAGTALTADGETLYLTDEALTVSGSAEELTVGVTCASAGWKGNALTQGMEMQAVVPIYGAGTIVCTVSASGGQDQESDDAYRERIRNYGLSSITTGPQQQYESAAMAVSSEIIDARALNLGAGQVGVYLLAEEDAGMTELIAAVESALNDASVRPLTDRVTVAAATEVPYVLNVKYSIDENGGTQSLITDAVEEYKTWQEETIGRAFNPEKLSALLYQAGATRVIWDTGSNFDGGSVEYTEIEPNEYCKGEISVAVMSE